MMGRVVLAALALMTLSAHEVASQVTRGPTHLTTCSTPFRPISGLTFHGGYAWPLTFHTYPGQFGHAHYSGDPSPVTSTDGRATWTTPGVNVECTLTWFLNPNGTTAYVQYNWHIDNYTGTISENGGTGCEIGVIDPIYLTSYDPYAPDQDDVIRASCSQGGYTGGGGGNTSCAWDWVRLEISYDGGKSWSLFWEGYTYVCSINEA